MQRSTLRWSRKRLLAASVYIVLISRPATAECESFKSSGWCRHQSLIVAYGYGAVAGEGVSAPLPDARAPRKVAHRTLSMRRAIASAVKEAIRRGVEAARYTRRSAEGPFNLEECIRRYGRDVVHDSAAISAVGARRFWFVQLQIPPSRVPGVVSGGGGFWAFVDAADTRKVLFSAISR